MKEHLRRLASAAGNDLARTCLVREYLQARILEALQDTGAFLRWAFLAARRCAFCSASRDFRKTSIFLSSIRKKTLVLDRLRPESSDFLSGKAIRLT